MEPVLQKNQVVELGITAISHEGSGIGRSRGMAVFVPMTAVGDQINCRIVKVLKNYAYGIVEEMVRPSSERIENDCPVYQQCGGCSFRHMDYAGELCVKAGWVRDNLRRIGGVELPVDAIVPSPCERRYRNKAQYPIRLVGGKVQAGFFAKRSHTLVPVEDCMLQPAEFAVLVRAVCAFMEQNGIQPYDEQSHSGLVRHLYLRKAEATGQVMVCLVVNGKGIPRQEKLVEELIGAVPGVATVILNTNRQRTNVILGDVEQVLYGSGTIEDTLCGINVRLSAASFYQVNRQAAQRLYSIAREYAELDAGGFLLDLYCGAGTIGLSMAPYVKRVAGVDVVSRAIGNAKENARQNGISNAEFYCGDASVAAEILREEGHTPDTVVLDPPRKGVNREVLTQVAQMVPQKMVYISCNSATQARDIALLAELGYEAVRAVAVDMFPRTAHVESIVVLKKICG